MQRKWDALTMVRIGLLAGAGALLTLWEVPILPSAPYLKWDASEVPALFGGFAMGPWVGLMVEFLKVVIFSLSGKNTTGIVGAAAMFVAGGTIVVVSSLLYHRLKTTVGLVFSLCAGSLAMTGMMMLTNTFVFLPLWGIKGEAIMPAIIGAVLPFNLLKGALTSAITFVLYKRVAVLLGVHFFEPQAEPKS